MRKVVKEPFLSNSLKEAWNNLISFPQLHPLVMNINEEEAFLY